MTDPDLHGAQGGAWFGFVRAPAAFWALLALPAMPLVHELFFGNVHRLLMPSGEYAARFLIATLLVSPLSLAFPQVMALRWLMKRRRALGVASFCYAALHTLAYLVDEGSLPALVAALSDTAIWTGWLAFLILVALAAISNDWALRRLGRQWKRLQRLAYGAAALAFVHWVTLQDHFTPALVHFAPLAALSLWRVGRAWDWWGSSRGF